MQLLSPVGRHRRPSIGMKGDFVALLQMLVHRFADEVLRVPRGFRFRDHPAHNIPAEKVKHEIEVVPLTMILTFQARNVPRPNLLRSGCLKNRRGVLAPLALEAPFLDFSILRKDPINGPYAAKIQTPIQKLRYDFPWGQVHEFHFMEQVQDRPPGSGQNVGSDYLTNRFNMDG